MRLKRLNNLSGWISDRAWFNLGMCPWSRPAYLPQALLSLAGTGLGLGQGLLLVPDDQVEQVVGEVSSSGLQGAAQLLATMAERAGEVEIFIAVKEKEQSGR